MVQDQLNAARELVNRVSDSAIKTSVIPRLDAVQGKIDEATQSRMAIDAVAETNPLFADGVETKQNIEDFEELYDKALNILTNIHEGYVKDELSYRLSLLNDLIDSARQAINSLKAVKQAVENLKTDETKPGFKKTMDHSLKQSLYLLPPFP